MARPYPPPLPQLISCDAPSTKTLFLEAGNQCPQRRPQSHTLALSRRVHFHTHRSVASTPLALCCGAPYRLICGAALALEGNWGCLADALHSLEGNFILIRRIDAMIWGAF